MDKDVKSTRLKSAIEFVTFWGIWGTLWFISGVGTADNFSNNEKIGAGILLAFVTSGIILLIRSLGVFQFSMVAALAALAMALLVILMRHYWLLLFIWLTVPFTALWLAGDIMRPRLSFGQHKTARGVLVGAALVLTFINVSNMSYFRLDLGKEYIEGYQITISHNCEEDAGEHSVAINGSHPGTCKIEDLSGVSRSGRLLLNLSELGFAIIAIVVVAVTMLISNSTIKRKTREDREAQEMREG